MIVVGVSRHGRLRRLFTGTTGDRIASLAGSIDVHLVTHEQVARTGARRAGTSRRSAGAARSSGWRWSRAAAGAADPGAATRSTTPTSCRSTCCSSSRSPCWSRWSAGCCPRWSARSAGFLLLNWFFTPPVGRLHDLRAGATCSRCWSSSPSPSGVATVVDRASRRAADAVRARTEAATLGALSRRCSPARTPPRRSSSGCARPSARTPSSLLAAAPAGLGGRRRRPAPRRPRPRRRRHPGAGRRRPRARALRRAAAGDRPAGARGVRRADRAGAGVPPAARARGARGRPGARRGHQHRAAARGLPRPAHPAGHHARLGRRAASSGSLGRRADRASWSRPSSRRPTSSSG